MPIEIIPKREIAPRPGISPAQILYYLMIFVLFASILIYFVLGNLLKKSQRELEELEAAIFQKETEEVRRLERKIVIAKERIDKFAVLFESYEKSSNAFDFLKKNCHKKVFFSKANLDVGGHEIVVSGNAESFEVLGEQMLIFQKQDIVRGVGLSQVSIGREGGIDFDLTLFFDPQLFK